MNMHTALFSMMHLYIWICVKVLKNQHFNLCLGICHTDEDPIGSDSSWCYVPRYLILFWLLGRWHVNCFSEHLATLTRKQARRLPVTPFLDWCLSVSFVIGFLKDFANEFVTVRLQASHSNCTFGLWNIYEWYVYSANFYLTLSVIRSRFLP